MNYEDIRRMVSEQVPETATLEYKAGSKLGRQGNDRDGLMKEVLAFANAAGGRLIFGVATHSDKSRKHLPERIAPVMDDTLTTDWLQQVVNSNSFPRFSALQIQIVHCPEGGRIIVLNIEAGNTAHQGPDHLYYQRAGLEALPMKEFQIRDVMSRRTGPQIELELKRVVKEESSSRHLIYYMPVMLNVGSVTLERWRLSLDFPEACIDRGELSRLSALYARSNIRQVIIEHPEATRRITSRPQPSNRSVCRICILATSWPSLRPSALHFPSLQRLTRPTGTN